MEAAARAALNSAATGVPLDQFRVRGGLTFAGVNGQPRGLYETPKNNFMPRVGGDLQAERQDGAARRLRHVLRVPRPAPRRRHHERLQLDDQHGAVARQRPDVHRHAVESVPGGIQEPQGAALGIETFLGQSITFFDPEPESPRMQRWQVGIQRELPGQMVLEASYVGNRGTHIQTSRNINATPLQYLSTSPMRDQATIDYLSANVPNPFFGLMPVTAGTAFRSATIARERLLRPYPQFDAVNTTTNEGKSWYHSLQAGLQKRFSRGLHDRHQLHLLALRGGHRVPERRRSGADPHDLEPGRAAPPVGQRHLGDSRRPRPALRART